MPVSARRRHLVYLVMIRQSVKGRSISSSGYDTCCIGFSCCNIRSISGGFHQCIGDPAFSALAAGGAILCSQYIGQKNHEMANKSARQVLFIITAISVAVTALCLLFRVPLLKLIFGKVEADVMTASQVLFLLYGHYSFPFIHSMMREHPYSGSQGNTRGPMTVSVISNVINIGGNAALIWGFNMGVAGAAIATLASRVFCAVVVLWQLRMDRQLL